MFGWLYLLLRALLFWRRPVQIATPVAIHVRVRR